MMRLIFIFLLSFMSFNNIYSQEIVEIDDKNEEILPVAVVNQAPVFKNCKKKNEEQLRRCFYDELNGYILKNIKYPKEYIKDSLTKKIYVAFKVDKKGKVFDLKTRRSALELFDKEAIRVIRNLPKLEPATNKGEKVIVQCYGIVNFTLE